MKRNIAILLVCLLAGSLMIGCKKKDDIDEQRQLIVGYWQRNGTQEYTRFMKDSKHMKDGNYLGYEWNAEDGTTEEDLFEEKSYHKTGWFEWYLDEGKKKNDVIQIHLTEMGFEDPKAYTITTLTETSMVLEDSNGYEKSYKKVSQPK